MMKYYVLKHFNTFIPEKRDLKDAVQTENPVPTNINTVKKLDSYLRDLLKEKSKQTTLSTNQVFEKVQTKDLAAMGPSSKLWACLENSTNPEVETTETVEDLLKYVEQTILLIGQTNVSLTYHRRLNILYSVMANPTQSKGLFKENARSFQPEDENLFGKEFKNHMSDVVKSRKETKAVLSEGFLNSERKKWPFPRGFSKPKQTWQNNN